MATRKSRRKPPPIIPEGMLPSVPETDWKNNYCSPLWIISKARKVMGGIDLDPASSELANRWVKAGQIYTVRDNGVTKPWKGKVFMNPPYSGMPAFATKLLRELPKIDAAIMLCESRTETKWWRSLREVAEIVCLPSGRLEFWNPFYHPPLINHKARTGSCVFGFKVDTKRFREVFGSRGTIWL